MDGWGLFCGYGRPALMDAFNPSRRWLTLTNPQHPPTICQRELADAGLLDDDDNDEEAAAAADIEAGGSDAPDDADEADEADAAAARAAIEAAAAGEEEDAGVESGRVDRHGLPVELRMDDYDDEEGDGEGVRGSVDGWVGVFILVGGC